MIPQIIHYCWFGNTPKSDEIIRCIESWKKFMPNWKILEWNEQNFDINKYTYTQEAYKLKKWAFVSDIARLDILYQYGGIYLDIDVEFIKSLPEYFLECSGICGFEYTNTIAPGLILGVEKGNEFIKKILDSYINEHFYINKRGWYKTINTRITEQFEMDGLKKNNQLQIIDGFHIYPSEYFCGYNTDIREPEITENTICWHHYLGSWSKPSIKMRFQNILTKRKLTIYIRSKKI